MPSISKNGEIVIIDRPSSTISKLSKESEEEPWKLMHYIKSPKIKILQRNESNLLAKEK